MDTRIPRWRTPRSYVGSVAKSRVGVTALSFPFGGAVHNFLTMIHAIYQFIGKLGYTHPLHPMVTHITIGLTIGTLAFAIISLLFRRVRLKLTAFHCAVLAVVSIFPTVLLGYMDWQEKFGGQWIMTIIIKMILAGALFVCLLAGLLLGRLPKGEAEGADQRPWRSPRAIAALVLYFVCTGIVIALGFLGGSLVY